MMLTRQVSTGTVMKCTLLARRISFSEEIYKISKKEEVLFLQSLFVLELPALNAWNKQVIVY
jgi:hypothetical protein